MAIAHEIATNSDFKLENLQFPENRYEWNVPLSCYINKSIISEFLFAV